MAKSSEDERGPQVDVTPVDDDLLLSPVRRPREGWEEQFAAMAQASDDALLGDAVQTSTWDEREWKW